MFFKLLSGDLIELSDLKNEESEESYEVQLGRRMNIPALNITLLDEVEGVCYVLVQPHPHKYKTYNEDYGVKVSINDPDYYSYRNSDEYCKRYKIDRRSYTECKEYDECDYNSGDYKRYTIECSRHKDREIFTDEWDVYTFDYYSDGRSFVLVKDTKIKLPGFISFSYIVADKYYKSLYDLIVDLMDNRLGEVIAYDNKRNKVHIPKDTLFYLLDQPFVHKLEDD